MNLDIDPDIARARTPNPVLYTDPPTYAVLRERVFTRTWQWLGDVDDVTAPGSLSPRTLLPGLLDEPLLLARDTAGSLRCLSNVCTHRANLLVTEPCQAREIRCGYHSRRFDLAGRMTFMPEFAGVQNFPSPDDDLPQVAFADWDGHGFAALDPAVPFDSYADDLRIRLSGVTLLGLRHDPARDRDYEVAAHWALYVENYLEGFHIPFVHPGLAGAVDYASYATELFRYANLQVARAKPGEPAFAGGVAAYYAWIFPNLMLNFYPWGLSLNVVEPLGVARTRVRFRSYVGDASKLESGAGGGLDKVEAEDEAVVEAVQRGVSSRLYRGGRYSPTRERGVHHFHRLLAEFLEGQSR